jgi:hypothetical protein
MVLLVDQVVVYQEALMLLVLAMKVVFHHLKVIMVAQK